MYCLDCCITALLREPRPPLIDCLDVSEREALAVAPHAVGGGRTLADASVGVGEDEPDVQIRLLLFDEQHLLAVFRDKPALGLDDDAVGQHEVWLVPGIAGWHLIEDVAGFVEILDGVVSEILTDQPFKSTPETVLSLDDLRAHQKSTSSSSSSTTGPASVAASGASSGAS